MRAGREHARTTGKPGWTDSNRDSNVAEKGPVGGEPVGTARASTDCHGLWDRPGPDLRICECVVTAVLGGLPSGPVVSGDSLRIWPLKRVPFV